ncbi:MAG: peptidylprolyl isomerase [Bacteroidota bacterium]
MKLIFSLFLITLTCQLSFAQEGSKSVIDKIVAQIGDNIILKSDIEAQKLQAAQSGMEVTKETDCIILEQLMFQNLLLNQAEIDSIVITDAQVDAEMENRIRVIENQIGGRDKMEKFYGKSITEIKNEFRDMIRKRLMSEEMERQITQDIAVTPKEIEAFFKTIPKDSIPLINSKLSFQQIVVFPEITKEDKELARQKLEDIRQNIIGGKSFETQARIHSQDPGSAAQGGKLEASRGMMVAPFEATVFSLKEGEISQVFETEFGYHIIQLIERKGDDYVCRHILIAPEFNRESLDKSSKLIEECYQALKQNTITWENAVMKYSNDANTKQNRGIITNPITGEQTWSMEDLNQVDQQIYLLTDALNKGDISSPSFYFDYIERKQGIRIVRLMERTSPHYANLTDDYSLIQKATENKKKEDTLNKWVSSKLSNAYIRIDQDFTSCKFRHNWLTTP